MAYLFMILASFAVCGAMLATLSWFFRRLREIEEERWGPHTRVPLKTAYRALLFRIRHRVSKE